MYAISDAEYIKDFTMLLNDDIIDCFTEKTTVVQEKEINAVSEEIKMIRDIFTTESIDFNKIGTDTTIKNLEKSPKTLKRKSKRTS